MKALQKLQAEEREEEDRKAFAVFERKHLAKGHVEAPPTERFGGCGLANIVPFS